MSSSGLKIRGWTDHERHQITAEIDDALDHNGAWIEDFHAFAHLATCFNLHVPLNRLAAMCEELMARGVKLDAESWRQVVIAQISGGIPLQDPDVVATLQVLFTGEPDPLLLGA